MESPAGVRETPRKKRGISMDEIILKASRTTRQNEGLSNGVEDKEMGHTGDSDDTTDDNDTAATPASKSLSESPRERHEPFSVIKFPRLSRNSERRLRHGYCRYLQKLMKLGESLFQRPSDN
ncbi:hypothetical protein MRX96_058928 [Rhipicephalus microplus]